MTIRHSSHCQESNKSSTNSSTFSKSDLNFASSINRNECLKTPKSLGSQGEYYKRYEHDEVPVKDSSTDHSNSNTNNNKKSLTNSELEKLEARIFKNVSQELQTDDGSLSSLESNIKIFKTTVEKIFDNFYTSMRDFEHYKSRFHAILDRSKDGSIDDMEDFIRDIFDHIMSSENSASNISRQISQKSAETTTLEPRDKDTFSSIGSTYTEPNLSTGVLEAYRNDHYLTDSTIDENAPRGKGLQVEEILNIFLLGGNPCVQIKMNDRKLLSEINIQKPSEVRASAIASADDIKTRAAKRLEVERYVKQQDHNIPERNIPIKISYAKKNIYLNEDFARNENSEPSKSLISKICNILCKKFRKSTFG